MFPPTNTISVNFYEVKSSFNSMNWDICYFELSNHSHWHIYLEIIALSLIWIVSVDVEMLRRSNDAHWARTAEWLASFRQKDKHNAAGFPQSFPFLNASQILNGQKLEKCCESLSTHALWAICSIEILVGTVHCVDTAYGEHCIDFPRLSFSLSLSHSFVFYWSYSSANF